MGTFTEGVEVEQDAEGLPLHLAWRGGRYTLAVEPVRWYARRNWWDEETRAAPGAGAELVDREIWRVQVRRDGAGGDAPLRTLDLVRYLPAGRWRIIKIHEALNESVEELDPGA